MSTIANLTAAYAAYERARTAHEEPNGEVRFELLGSFRAPTSDEYAGYQIVRHGSPEAALAAMQADGCDVQSDMESISRNTAAIIAAAMRRS